jgi:hypothetical protein
LGSIGARESAIGVASHHHTAAIKPSDIKRSANGVRREISSDLWSEMCGELRKVGTRVPVLTFVSYRGMHFYECQNQRGTSKHMILVCL